MNVQTMQHRAGYAQLSPFLPVLHPLWGKDYSAIGQAANIRIGVQHKADVRAKGVGRLGTQRAGNQKIGEGFACDWPGRCHGIRSPGLGETPLSWEEVVIAVNQGAQQ